MSSPIMEGRLKNRAAWLLQGPVLTHEEVQKEKIARPSPPSPYAEFQAKCQANV